jgi:hypothetical protein
MCPIRILLALTAVLLGIAQVEGQFSNVPAYTPPAIGGVSGLPNFNPAMFGAPAKHPIKEALAEAIVLNAETKKAKHTGADTNAVPDSVAPSAKTKNFAYTSISVPTATPTTT